jgi:dienelactone hydrolase
MRFRPRPIPLAALLAVIGVGLAAPPAARWWRAGMFLSALSTAHAATPADRPAPGPAPSDLVEEELSIPGTGGPIRARIYRRADRARGRGLVVAHGVHYQGIDERRMVPFVRGLARTGLVVLTPELADLADYRITRDGVSVIRDAALYLAARHDLVDEPRVGLLGFSFAGGLSLVAATDPALRDRVAFVASVGGHHDLARVLRFLIRNQVETPDGPVAMKAHDYGLDVLLYGALDRFIGPVDRDAMHDALRARLRQDPAGADAAAARLTTDEGRRLWQLTRSQGLQALAPTFEAVVAERRDELAALSPRGRLAAIHAPVYLVHGSEDSVIPPSETAWASRELGGADHLALVTPLLEHVEVSRTAGLVDKLALIRFIAQLL